MLAGAAPIIAADPYADHVAAYDAGSTPAPGYTDPTTALGSPERFTGESSGYPSVVSVFNPAFEVNELVSIGEGGWLVLRFDEPIRDDASNPFGIDLLIFGNGGFVDVEFPNGRTGSPPVLFGLDPIARLALSADGANWAEVSGEIIEGFFPAQGYLDSGPYDDEPGQEPTDFSRPVNPAYTLDDFADKTLADILAIYNGSGGGTPLDISSTGLTEASYVRIEVPDDGDPSTQLNVEVEAMSAVPEPSALILLGSFALIGARRRG